MSDDGTITWRELLAEASSRLDPMDARRIVEEASGFEGAEYALGLNEKATERGVHRFDALVARRLAGEPLQYVLGRWGFRQLDLMVDRRVLIPRPETEQVVEHALAELDRLRAARPDPDEPLRVVDLGTGSGAIALSIAAERPETQVYGVDVSADALAVARANLAGVGGRVATRVQLLEGSWFDPLPAELCGYLDLVISNPPYVALADPLPAEVADWEPAGALVSGPTGLEAVEVVARESVTWLAADGVLVIELGETQADAAVALAADAGFAKAEVRPDLAGRPRALVARRR